MKKAFLRSAFVLLVALISIQGCISKDISTIPATRQPTNAIFTGAASTIAAELTEAAKTLPPQTPVPFNPSWPIDSIASNFAIIVLDYQTTALKSAYFNMLPTCSSHSKVDDQILISQASNFFKAVMLDLPARVIPTGSGEKKELLIDLQHVGDFALTEIEPGDFGGAAVLDPCTGLVIFAGSIIWSGVGEHFYPATPIQPETLQYRAGQIAQPQQMDVRAGPYSPGTEGYEAAWNSVQALNLVQDFASAPYSVFIYLYPRAVGEFNPQHAEWLIFLLRRPS